MKKLLLIILSFIPLFGFGQIVKYNGQVVTHRLVTQGISDTIVDAIAVKDSINAENANVKFGTIIVPAFSDTDTNVVISSSNGTFLTKPMTDINNVVFSDTTLRTTVNIIYNQDSTYITNKS